MKYEMHNASAAAAFVGAAITVIIAINLVNPIVYGALGQNGTGGANTTALGAGGTALLALVGLVFVAVIVLYTLSMLS